MQIYLHPLLNHYDDTNGCIRQHTATFQVPSVFRVTTKFYKTLGAYEVQREGRSHHLLELLHIQRGVIQAVRLSFFRFVAYTDWPAIQLVELLS